MSLRSNKLATILLVLVIVLAIVAAIGWTRPTSTTDQTVSPNLVDEAKKEGTVTVYSVMDDSDFVKYFIPAFQAVYPWATVTHVSVGIGETYSRVLSEYKANHVTADVLQESIPNMLSLKQEGAIISTENSMEALMNYPAGQLDPEHYWHPGNANPILIMYNTLLVTSSDAPKSFEDLTNSKWRGKIVMQTPAVLDSTGSAFAQMSTHMSDSDWTNLMQGIVANQPIFTQTNSDAFQRLVSGEASVGIGYLNDYISGLAADQPVGASWTSPTYTPAFPFAGTTNAPHPNMARLWMEWFASTSGQAALAASGRTPYSSIVAGATVLAGVMPSGTTLETVTNSDFFQNGNAWTTKYQQFGF